MMKAVFFDLDGTLLNRDASVRLFIEKQYQRLHPSVKHVPQDRYITRFIELDNHGYVWKDKVYQQMVEEFNITKITWEDLLIDYIDQFKYCCVPFSNHINMLENLIDMRIKFGMITNGKGQFQMDNIKALKMDHYFESILISEREGIKKPHINIFQKAVDTLNVDPSECMFVGDHPTNDINAAKQAGMKTIWKRNRQWKDVSADFIVDDLADITEIIHGLNA